MAAPLVSVIIAAYRATDLLHRAVDSLRAQTMTDWEALLVDDGSPDDTLAECRRLATQDPRVRVVALPRNGGPAAARNAGLDHSRGVWVTILDADDAYVPRRLATLVEQAQAAGVDWIADNQQLYDLVADATARTAHPRGFAARSIDVTRFLADGGPGQRFHYGWLKPMIKRASWQASCVRYREQVRFGEDYLLYLEWTLRGLQGLFIEEPLYVYTTRRGQISGQASGTSRSPAQYGPMAAAMVEIEASYADTLAPATAQALAKRRAQIVGLAAPSPWRRAWTRVRHLLSDALPAEPGRSAGATAYLDSGKR